MTGPAPAVRRVDARDKVTGRAVYADDLALPGMLIARPLHSAHAHARIVSVDIAAARAVPGVVAVLTAADLPGARRTGGIIADHYVLAGDRVRYQGDGVALVAAESAEAARSGVDAIRVAYEPLAPITDPEAALRPGAPRVHPERADNVIAAYRVRRGDPAGVFPSCARVIEREYRTERVEHAYLEPESAVAVPEPDGSVTVHGSVQHPFSARRTVAQVCGLPLERARIVQTTLGGGFGGKDDTANLVCARAAILALRTRRPVKLTYTREESFRESYKRHPFVVRAKLGVDADARLQALAVDVTADGGPYCTTSPFVIWRPTVQCTGPYLVPHVHCDTRAVYTNNPLTGAMRGFGSPQINFAIESWVDEMAHATGLDPVEFRRRNLMRQGCVTHTGQRLDRHTVSIAEVMDRALERFGWEEAYARGSRGRAGPDGALRGVGIACSYRGVSLGAEGSDFCSAIVEVLPDGTIELQVGVSENGQGLKTAMARILATELGVPLERVRFLDTDTARVPDGGPTVASRATLVGGNAVLDAVRELRERMAPASGGPALAFDDAVAACRARGIPLRAEGRWVGPPVSWDEANGQGDAYFTYVYSCNLAEVEVQAATGRVRVLRLLGAHDVGRAIHRQMLEGQIYGGLLMGMGLALGEAYHAVDGIGVETNFDRYRICRANQAPELDAVIVENPDPDGPWGAKSIGEPANELAAPAIVNAIFHATGVRIRELPVTPEAVREGRAR
jgi:CO/xanthine dehydrogenase Mo-binding subunit